MEQLLVHIFGDYIWQSDWMAMNKNKRTFPCLIHVLLYTACFLLLTTSWKALLFIGTTHFIFDRFPIIIKRLIWLKNHMGPDLVYPPFAQCDITGYYDNVKAETAGTDPNKEWVHQVAVPDKCFRVSIVDYVKYQPRLSYITLWLYIITDNFLHLSCNYLALKYLA